MQVIIDRFEGAYAIVELPDKTMANIPKTLLPDAKEGDVINITVDKNATEKRRKDIQSLMNDVWE